jgi:glycosyltransferase involved in cell wall biosynthesis
LQSLTFFWIINFDYPTRLHSGSTLRHVNYSRELMQQGHRVFLGVQFQPQYEEPSRQWFASLREQGVIAGFFELSYAPPPGYLRMAAFTLFPSLGNVVLYRFQTVTTRTVEGLINELGVDIVILSDRRFLFLATTLPAAKPLVIDFCDCASLFWARELRYLFRARQVRAMLPAFRRLVSVFGEDRYYARLGRPLVVVSPVDERALRRIAGESSQIFILLNGVSLPSRQPSAEKVRNRLIFSGNMNFSPNYTAVLWFLDHVFPLVLEQLPDVQFVVAGANPPHFLQERASGNVVITGYVEDLNREIAHSALYVVPMISGGGFKNKVVEAVANRTYIVATSIAVEFLDPSLRELIAVADDAKELAEAIVVLLRDPIACASRVSALYDHVSRTFSWSRRATELVQIVSTCIVDVRGVKLFA